MKFFNRFGLVAVTTLLGLGSFVGIASAGTSVGTNITISSGYFLVNNSTSTINNLDMVNSSSTNATSTNLYISNFFQLIGSLLVNAASSTINNLSVITSTTTNAVMTSATSTNATTTTMLVSGNFTASSTILTTSTTTIMNGLQVGTSTSYAPFFQVVKSSVGTTTIDFGDQFSANSKTCFNVKGSSGNAVSFYVNNAATPVLIVENNRCK